MTDKFLKPTSELNATFGLNDGLVMPVSSEKKLEATELERDENGFIFGYKVLEFTTTQSGKSRIISPYRLTEWRDNTLTSYICPREDNEYGIYGMKTPDDPELRRIINFIGQLYAQTKPNYRYKLRIVRFAASGTIIESERGIRAERAKIVEIL